MSANLVIGDILRLRAVMQDASRLQTAFNVSHWQCTALTGAATTDTDALLGLQTPVAAKTKDVMSNKALYYGTDIQRVYPGTPTIPVSDLGAQAVGNRAGDHLPPQVAGLVTLRTALAGRAYRGRKYIPFVSEDDSDINGHPTAAILILMQALASVYASVTVVNNAGATGTATLTPVIYNRAAHTTQPITSYIARSSWATQRRRSDINRSDSPPF